MKTPDQPRQQSTGHDDIKGVDTAREALVRRRHFSLRLQLYIGFLIVFLFAAGAALLLLITTNQVEKS